MEENFPEKEEKGSDTEEIKEEIKDNDNKETEVTEEKKAEKESLPEGVPHGKKSVRDLFDMIDAIVIAIVASLFILTLIFRTGYVSGDSMKNTMHDGDRYIVSNLFYKPEKGDIIVFEPDPSLIADEEKLYVKRVIATEGDRVEIRKNNLGIYEVIINGQVQKEEYLDSFQVTEPHFNNTEIDENGNRYLDLTVPKGHVFVMGDNRINSHDGRDLGPVDTRRIVGKILLRFFPFNQFGPVA